MSQFAALALVAAAVTVGTAAVLALYQTAPETLRSQRRGFVAMAIGAPAALAALAPPGITGDPRLDTIVVSALSLAFGGLATGASRNLVFVVAASAALASPRGALALGLAAAPIVLQVRLPVVKAAAGSCAGLAVAWAFGDGPSWRMATGIGLAIGALGWEALRPSRGEGWWPRLAVAATGVWLFGAVALLAAASVTARADIDRALAAMRIGLAAASDARVSEAQASFARAQALFGRADSRVRALSLPALSVPGLSHNARLLRIASASGRSLAAAAERVARQGDPRAVKITDGRVDLEALQAFGPPLRALLDTVEAAQDSRLSLDRRWLLPPASRALHEFDEELARAERTAALSAEAVVSGARMLGSERPRRYFIALTTPAETRASGGILGAYAVLASDKGALSLERAGTNEELNAAGDPASRRLDGLREYVRRYGRFSPTTTWQNVTLSPDFPTVARVIEQLYPQSGGPAVDGVVSVDPDALAAILSATGPVTTALWPEAIGATSVSQVLHHDQYLRLQGEQRDRFLLALVREVFNALTTRQVDARTIMTSLRGSVAQRHLVLHSTDGAEQHLLSQLGATGAISATRGDALAVVTQNSSGNKIDYFLRRSTTYDVSHDARNGSVVASLRVELSNTAPARGLPPIVIAGAPHAGTRPGDNRMYLSIYSPLQLDHLTINGRPVVADREREFGRNVYSVFLTVGPKETATVAAELKGTLALGESYRLDVRHQVLVVPESLRVRVRKPSSLATERKIPAFDRDFQVVVDERGARESPHRLMSRRIFDWRGAYAVYRYSSL